MPIQALYTTFHDDAEARTWLTFLQRHGYHGLQGVVIERVYWLEGAVRAERLSPLFANPLYQTISQRSALDPGCGPIIEIAYRPAVTDPETPSILAAAHSLGETGLEFARLSRRYQFLGIDALQARKLAERFLFNKIVERIREPGDVVVSLRPTGEPDPVRLVSLAQRDDAELQALSIARSWYAPLSQLRTIQARECHLGRAHTDAEIEILVQSWSDHCYHTTWKSLGLLQKLSAATARIQHPLVVSAFKDNAGGLEFYDGWVITIKGETHNFPSSIAPFGGVSTKHGGVIRDTLGFGKGAYPIGGTTIMGVMNLSMPEETVPQGALPPRFILSESIRATAYYMNPMGIPMMHLAYRCHPGYAKCFALGHSLGLIPTQYALKENPRPGDVILLIGGETGRDGIHGATASSASMRGETVEKESAAVQIGHPITERRFTTAIPVLRDAGCIRSITDLGAGGISSAVGEMGGETGASLELDAVPVKDRSLTAWEILLSESQERMLIAVPPEKISEAQALLDRYEVAHAVIGRFTNSNKLEAAWRGERVVDLEMSFLWGACPIDPIPAQEPARRLTPLRIREPRNASEWGEAVHGVLGHIHCADQSAAGFRFDSTVQGRTALGPYGGKNHCMPAGMYVSAPLYGASYGVIFTVAFNPLYGEIDPATMARLMVVEAVTRAVAAGADYRDLALCDNFYTPRVRPEVAWDLTRMVEAIADLSVELGIPFISGKDSSSGVFEADGQIIEVPPTLAVAAFGRVSDVKRLITKDFKQAGSKVVLVGHTNPGALGGSVYADAFGQRGDSLFIGPDGRSARAVWDALLRLRATGQCRSAAPIGEGGLLLRLFEAAFGSELGARVDFDRWRESRRPPPAPGVSRRDGMMFGEFIGAVAVEVAPSFDAAAFFGDLPHAVVGEVIAEARLELTKAGQVLWQEPVSSLAEIWSQPFREILE